MISSAFERAGPVRTFRTTAELASWSFLAAFAAWNVT